MTLAAWATVGLLTAGVAVVGLASLGQLRFSAPLDRLHLAGLTATSGLGLICAAVLVAHPLDQYGIKALLLMVISWCFAPVLSHAQASLAYRVLTSDREPSANPDGDVP